MYQPLWGIGTIEMMNYKKSFNALVFIGTFSVVFLMMIVSFVAAAAVDEGTSGEGKLTLFFAQAFNVLRFPFHTLLWKTIVDNMVLYFPLLLLNIIFYSLIIERIVVLTVFDMRKAGQEMN